MKKFLAGCAVAIAVVVAAVAVLMVWAFRTGAQHQEQFFAAVYSGDVNQVMALFDPALQEEVDPPVMAEWMEAMERDLGRPQGLKASQFSTNKRFENGVTITESSGTVAFEKGTAQSELVLHGDRIVRFNVKSDQLVDWFQELSDTGLYRDRAQQCLERMFSGREEEAHAMMHPNLQQILPLDQIRAAMAELGPQAGALQGVTCASEEFQTGDETHLVLLCTVDCAQQDFQAEMDFEFVGLKGHLVGVDLGGAPTEADAEAEMVS